MIDNDIVLKFTIPLPPITKKNSQRILRAKGGRSFIAPSSQYVAYKMSCKQYIKPEHQLSIDYPIECRYTYYMPTRRIVDASNLMEATDDVLTDYMVLKDDNSRIIVSHDGTRVLYDKDNPRTEIEIIRCDLMKKYYKIRRFHKNQFCVFLSLLAKDVNETELEKAFNKASNYTIDDMQNVNFETVRNFMKKEDEA